MEWRDLGRVMVVLGILTLSACSSFQKIDVSSKEGGLDRVKAGSTVRVTREDGGETEFVVRKTDQENIYGDKEQVKSGNIQKLEVKKINNKRTAMLAGLVVGALSNPVMGLGWILLSYVFISP